MELHSRIRVILQKTLRRRTSNTKGLRRADRLQATCTRTAGLITTKPADVEIMLEQLKLIYGPTDEWKKTKLERLEMRIHSANLDACYRT